MWVQMWFIWPLTWGFYLYGSMLLLYTIREKLWIIANPKIKTQINNTRPNTTAEKGKKSLVLFKKRKRDEKHDHTKDAQRGFYTLPVIFTVTVCGCARLWLCVSVYEGKKNFDAGPQDRSPAGRNSSHTQQKPLCLCSPAERCYLGPTVTQHSPAGEQNLQTGELERVGQNQRVALWRSSGDNKEAFLIIFWLNNVFV